MNSPVLSVCSLALLVLQGVWTPARNASTPSYASGAESVAGQVYLVSGFATTRVESFDPATTLWTSRAPLPQLLQYFGTAVINGKIYVVGGDTGGSGQVDTLYEYDPAGDAWTPRAAMPGGVRWSVVSAEIGGKLYAVGGRVDAAFVDRNECWDPATNTWTAKAPVPVPRDGVVAAAIGGKLYLAGGHQAGGGEILTVHIYDPVLDSWSTGPPLPRNFSEGVAAGTRLFMMGGGPFPEDEVQVLDTIAGTWSAGTPMFLGRHDFALAWNPSTSRIHAMGGFRGDLGILAGHQILDPAASPPPPAGPPPPSPAPAVSSGDGEGDDERCGCGSARAAQSNPFWVVLPGLFLGLVRRRA
jgi:hypothetical protein